MHECELKRILTFDRNIKKNRFEYLKELRRGWTDKIPSRFEQSGSFCWWQWWCRRLWLLPDSLDNIAHISAFLLLLRCTTSPRIWLFPIQIKLNWRTTEHLLARSFARNHLWSRQLGLKANRRAFNQEENYPVCRCICLSNWPVSYWSSLHGCNLCQVARGSSVQHGYDRSRQHCRIDFCLYLPQMM